MAAPDAALNPDTGAEKWLVTRTRERYRAVQDLLAQGWTISAIGRELGLARHTARRYARCENPDALADHAIRTTRLDAYRPCLINRWNQGCINASTLFREIQAGLPGPHTTSSPPLPAPVTRHCEDSTDAAAKTPGRQCVDHSSPGTSTR
ncbi:helix-turn-helix domain-containing protein [Streptomyces sp. NPDC101234]|uniref:helix-turn-helix domain-containing protein n=1 Tax=Streptomyces sp. NPDC101234 TaxID=3366138 RepID=UPI0037F7B98F